jgi:hypothetical protein
MHIKSAAVARPRNYRINKAYPQAPMFMSTFMPLTVDAQRLPSHVSKPIVLHQSPVTAIMQIEAQAQLLPGCCLHIVVVISPAVVSLQLVMHLISTLMWQCSTTMVARMCAKVHVLSWTTHSFMDGSA